MKLTLLLLTITVSWVVNAQTLTINATQSYLNQSNSGDYYIFSGSASTLSQVDKPLILLEGLDLTNEFGASAVFGFFFGGRETNQLANQLAQAGYDIITLNFTDANDYIQRNAFVLVELINQVNAQKHGSEPITVIGLSTGGIIARYALAWMEHNNMPHNVGLYASVDAPHRGFNIPPGVQFLADNLDGGYIPGGVSELMGFESTLVKQLAVWKNELGGTRLGQDALFTSFFNDMRSLNGNGYPHLCTNIAISNGNRSGTKSASSATPLWFDFYAPDASPVLGSGDGKIHTFYGYARLLPGKDGWNPQPAPNTMFELGRVEFGPVGTKTIKHFMVPYNLMDGIDRAPGGTFNFYQLLGNRVRSIQPYQNITRETGGTEPPTCFVPATSSLDLGTEWFLNLKADPLLPCSIPFDAYYIPDDDNQPHGLLSTIASNWLFNHIVNTPNITGPYNYGVNTSNIISQSITVTGTMGINLNQATDNLTKNASYGNAQPIPPVGSTFEVSTHPCKNITITIANNGTVQVGSGDRYGKLVITSGSKLVLKNGGTLDVRYGSKVIIASGGKLVFEPGATINLQDPGSVIEVTDNGQLEIAANATFTWEGKGIVRFNTATRGVSNVVASGTNAHFYKRGNGALPYTDKLVEITGGGSLSIDKSVSSFTLKRGHVQMGENALLDVDPKMSCTQVKFTGDINKRHNGIIVYGQQNDAYLTDCVIENARWGFLALNFSGTATQAKLSGCKFSNNIIGAYIQGKGADLSYCTFWNNIETAIRLDMLTLPAYLNKITAESNGYGLVANSTAYSLINVNNSVFYANKTGIHATDAMLSTGCSRVHKSLTSNVVAGNFTTLAYEPARWPATGNSLFYNEHDHGIVADQASDLHLDKAHNHFQVNNTTGIFGFYGMLKGRGTVLPSRKPVQADENYWNTTGTAPVMFTPSVTTADYSLQYRYGTTTPDLAITDQHPLTTAPGFSVCTPGGGGSTLPGTGGGQPAVVADKPALTLSNGQDAGVYFVDGLDLLYSDHKYTDAITVYSLLINHPYSMSKTILLPTGEYTSEFGVWGDFVMASYEKMLEALTSGIASGQVADYATKPEWYNAVKDAQDVLVSRFMAGGDAYEYEYAVKLRMDRALLYLLMNNPNACSLQLVNLLEGEAHTIANENLLKFMVCNVQRQIQLRNQQITRLDYAALSEGCAETLGLVYETTALSLTEEPADPPYITEQPPLGKRGNNPGPKKAKEPRVSAAVSKEVAVYPNPSKGLLYIDPMGNTIHEVVVYDVLGKAVVESRSGNSIQLAQAGVYIMEIKTNSGTYFKKVVIEQ